MKNKYDIRMGKLQSSMLADFHRLMLEALRQREQDVIKYIAILAPALGCYIWLLENYGTNTKVFVTGTLGVMFILLVGAVYTTALGYNYRYITLQLAKIETLIDTRDFILVGWPRDAKTFGDKYGKWCDPPEVIKVFWLAFLFAIVGVTISSAIRVETLRYIVIAGGIWTFMLAFFPPKHFGSKILRKCSREKKWKPIDGTQ